MKPVLIHTHFHKRKTGVTRSIENVLPFFVDNFETYVYGSNIDGTQITTSKLKSILFSDVKTVVHCHRNNEIIRMLWFRFLGGKFTLIATRHAETKLSGLTKFLLKKADRVITLIKSMSANLGMENIIVGHGVKVNEFVPKEGVVFKEIKQENIILNAGRVRKAKGQLVLLEAAKVLKDHKNWALLIVGQIDKPTFSEELKEITKKHQIENQVYFIDETREIISYYQAAKIVVAPSYSEGFSLVTAEAMSCECSLIATKNVGVHSELITDTKNGYLFEAGNVSELERLLSQKLKGEIPLLGKQARAEIIKNCSAKEEAESLMKVYQSN
ncbi:MULTISPECIES: glycosyltransferase family 4 protein [unclassified Polaribacter]|uniref:glycosyltransferase family 4 protein n=1 Tax=unclassified Polaribacter TaxID=196858 RepID=UPI0011BFB585|nr:MULTISPECIES: glycosyltransferase family 4 protein [unclassified Polaribacter]TXD52187.1 glycosyltransferase family 4 protein [Polaribacter sp. IC063]TXD60099.1 glycosyltransferase family 4 protein [Polaribacter sp. IC066]